jgi:hypothetical protein
MHLKTALGGLAIALLLALSAADVTLFGIAFWKIALAGVGAMIFVLGRGGGEAAQ